MKQLALIFFFILVYEFSYSQDTTLIAKYDKHQLDTFYLTPKKFKKTVVFDYHSISFYVDYNTFKKVVTDRLKGYKPYRKETYETTLRKIQNDIRDNDTIFLSQSIFDSAQIIPFDGYLIDKIETDRCVIVLKNGDIIKQIIRAKVTKYWNPGIWGGRLYFIPGEKKHFIESTDIVS